MLIHGDETTVQVLKEKDKEATSTSFMWAYRSGEDSGEPIVLLDYQPGRRQIYPQAYQACMDISWHDMKNGKTGKHKGCWTWFRHGKRYLTLWSGVEDKKNDYSDSELKLLRKGDAVTKTVAALKAKQ